MTAIDLTCQCGAAGPVPAEALLASANVEDLDPHFAGVVSWICSCCRQVVTAQLAWREFLTLITVGVPLIEEDSDSEAVPDFPPHPEHPISGRSFIPDDLLELHELLATDGWFSALTATPSVTP